jgi:hypothetical protein
MDYGGILKRAWNVTWKYKILWLFGLFAGGFGGSGGGNSSGLSSRTGTTSTTSPFNAQTLQQLQTRIVPYVGLIILVAAVLVIIGIVFWIIAARGGLVHLVSEAEERRGVRASDGWGRGFHFWGRVFGVEFLLGLPALVIGGITAVAVVVGILGAVRSGNSSAAGAAILSALGGMCFLLVIVVILGIAYALIVGPVLQLALRYVVLKDQRVIEAIKSGWHDLWNKRGAFLMYLLMVAVGIGVGIASTIVFIPVVLVSVALVFLGPAGWVLAGLVVLGVALAIGAVTGTFHSAAWTIFFRRMTGMEKIGVQQPAWAGPPSADRELIGFPPAAGSFPPPPPVAGQEPSPVPPAAPAPPAPSAPTAPTSGGEATPTGGQPATGDPKNPWEF